MICDAIRSAYKRSCRFTTDGPVGVIRWYFSPPGALFLPIPSVFMSLNWTLVSERPLATDVPGENLSAGTRYDKGTPPSGATGQQYCGTPSDFLGQAASLPPPGLPTDHEGLPLACRVGVKALWGIASANVYPSAIVDGPRATVLRGAVPSSVAVTGQLLLGLHLAPKLTAFQAFGALPRVGLQLRGAVPALLAFGGHGSWPLNLLGGLELGVGFGGVLGSRLPLAGALQTLFLGGAAFAPGVRLEDMLTVAAGVRGAVTLAGPPPPGHFDFHIGWATSGYLQDLPANQLTVALAWSVSGYLQQLPTNVLTMADAWVFQGALTVGPPNTLVLASQWEVVSSLASSPGNVLTASSVWSWHGAFTNNGVPAGI
jgi:hypothetical protein